jgi:exodeoxyribonuclease VII small subunit
MAADPVPAPQTFEDAYRALQSVVEQLQAGGLGLEASVALYEQGVALARRCEEIVDQAELRVLRVNPEAGAGPHPLDPAL